MDLKEKNTALSSVLKPISKSLVYFTLGKLYDSGKYFGIASERMSQLPKEVSSEFWKGLFPKDSNYDPRLNLWLKNYLVQGGGALSKTELYRLREACDLRTLELDGRIKNKASR